MPAQAQITRIQFQRLDTNVVFYKKDVDFDYIQNGFDVNTFITNLGVKFNDAFRNNNMASCSIIGYIERLNVNEEMISETEIVYQNY